MSGDVSGVAGAFCGWIGFATHTVDVGGGYGNVGKEQALGFAIVAFRVLRRDAAFVTPPQVQVRPVDALAPGVAREKAVELFGRAAAGEGDVLYARTVADGGEFGGDMGDEGVAVGVDMGVLHGQCLLSQAFLGCRQTRPLRAIILSASTGPQLPGS